LGASAKSTSFLISVSDIRSPCKLINFQLLLFITITISNPSQTIKSA
jgi:hypothetical protein